MGREDAYKTARAGDSSRAGFQLSSHESPSRKKNKEQRKSDVDYEIENDERFVTAEFRSGYRASGVFKLRLNRIDYKPPGSILLAPRYSLQLHRLFILGASGRNYPLRRACRPKNRLHHPGTRKSIRVQFGAVPSITSIITLVSMPATTCFHLVLLIS